MKNITHCTTCVLDTNDDPNITFNNKGVCNYCTSYYEKYVKNPITGAENESILNQKI